MSVPTHFVLAGTVAKIKIKAPHRLPNRWAVSTKLTMQFKKSLVILEA
ncbi:hypothetical protein ACIKP7_14305 [Pseudomonas caricapapayae]|jgi:hypothetical protein|uniref:Uncharacterized protein n=1 Tax=Pseudomonas caricapapayae TaxID=46678 RepID=A0ACC7LXH0_9PSED